MATEPQDVADIGGNRNTETTEVTNAMASLPGFPAKTFGGDIVRIVSQTYVEQKLKVMTDSDGQRWVDGGPEGLLVAYYDEDDEPVAAEDEEVQGGVDAVYNADAMAAAAQDAVAETAEQVEEAVAETIADESQKLPDADGLAESA